MYNLLMIIPFVVCVILFFVARKRVVWWEYCIIVLSSIFIIYLGTAIIIKDNCSDIEWLNYPVRAVRYYEPWDEWIKETCTKRVPCGKDSEGNTIYKTEEYDCSYRKYHDEQYVIVVGDNDNAFEQEIKESFYNKILLRWIVPGKNDKGFHDLHRKYYRIDGDMYETQWNGQIKDYFLYTLENTYKNKIKGSKSIFNFEDISEKEKSTYQLYDYYPVEESNDYGPVLGWFSAGNTYQSKVYGSNNKELCKYFEYINGELAPKYQINLLLCLYNANIVSKEAAFKQQSYWEGGNKNEMVICMGVDSVNMKIKWSKVFSWSETPEVECKTEQFFIKYDSLSVNETFVPYTKFIMNNIEYWKRKEFSDFDYINPELTYEQLEVLGIIVLIWNIIHALIFILNSKNYNKYGEIVDY